MPARPATTHAAAVLRTPSSSLSAIDIPAASTLSASSSSSSSTAPPPPPPAAHASQQHRRRPRSFAMDSVVSHLSNFFKRSLALGNNNRDANGAAGGSSSNGSSSGHRGASPRTGGRGTSPSRASSLSSSSTTLANGGFMTPPAPPPLPATLLSYEFKDVPTITAAAPPSGGSHRRSRKASAGHRRSSAAHAALSDPNLTSSSCRCCRAELVHRVDAPAVRCGDCLYVNDLKPWTPPHHLAMDALSLSFIENLLQRRKSADHGDAPAFVPVDDHAIAHALAAAFADLAVLNASFLAAQPATTRTSSGSGGSGGSAGSASRNSSQDTVGDDKPDDADRQSLKSADAAPVPPPPAQAPAPRSAQPPAVPAKNSTDGKPSSSSKPKVTQPHGLDLDAVRSAWALIDTLPVEPFHATILTAMLRPLMRVGQALTNPHELRAWLIMFESPLLRRHSGDSVQLEALRIEVLARLLGHLSALPNHLHFHLVEWALEWPVDAFTSRIDLIHHFITHRLVELAQGPSGSDTACTANYTALPRPWVSTPGSSSGAADDSSSTTPSWLASTASPDGPLSTRYTNDWPIMAAARTMALLFSANTKRPRVHLSTFYNTMIDLQVPLLRDFDAWERRAARFTFCQYPFLLSLQAKITLIEFEARRQMYARFREAMAAGFTAEMAQQVVHQHQSDRRTDRRARSRSGVRASTPASTASSGGAGGGGYPGNESVTAAAAAAADVPVPFIPLTIRRSHLVQDSMDQLSDPDLDLKKRLRVEFAGEEGIDAGGLTKEWLMLLVRDLFDPSYGLWLVPNEGNPTCWFHPACPADMHQEYYLVGVVVGLAVYHSTILDVPLASACYKKLLGNAVGLEDLASLDVALAHGLQQLLDYPGDDVEAVFCRDFVAEYGGYGGERVRVPLIPDGENTPVTSSNKHAYVAAYVDFILTKSVTAAFDNFRRGFLRVLQGNALSLFRAEEIELLVRGTADIDLGPLQATAEYDGFRSNDTTVRYLWRILHAFDPDMKRQFLRFLTGTDRIPATGVGNVHLKITCVDPNPDSDRLPTAHTCFNQLCLAAYTSKSRLERKLRMAILESQGFGIK
ncbi:putative E3 ubiquitin-protein ligase [Allomyces javanicus]|nr:putative E3 ubiquitin-protein ligase [Allomyces javanicus]